MHTCSKCNQTIVPPSAVATYENKYYHPECLKCTHCSKSLSGRQFIKEKNGNLTCEECNAKYAPKCKRCNQIFGPGQSYKKISEELLYHNECFKCCGPCHKPIGSEFYDIEEGKFLCVECYDKYGNDYEKYVQNDDDVYNRPPPPIPKSEPPQAKGGVDKLASNFDETLNLNPSNNNKANNNNNSNLQNKSVNVEVLPAVQREKSEPAKEDDSDMNCAKCNQPLTGTYTVYSEKKYHTKCFACAQCNQEFKEKTFFKLNGNPICRNCHSKNLVDSASKCRKCMQPILDTIVTFKNGEYHDYCLVCNHCSKKLIGQSIYTDKAEKPYCVDCFTKKEGKYCAKCTKAIAPTQANLVFEEKNFHKECFRCQKCSRQISASESFYKSDESEDGIICSDCINK